MRYFYLDTLSFQCLFEWKYSSGNVELQTDECQKYHNRVTFLGDYNNDTCTMQLDNVTLDDAGHWTCELEEYKWGSRRGDTDKQTVSLIVNVNSAPVTDRKALLCI